MKKIDLGQSISILANLGVIAGIVFLGFELRQTNSAIQSASLQAVTNSSSAALLLMASDDDLASIRRRGDSDFSSLSDDEVERYNSYYRQYWLGFQNNYFQSQLGTLQPGVWGSYSRIICQNIGESGVRTSWPDHQIILDPAFVAVVESCEEF